MQVSQKKCALAILVTPKAKRNELIGFNAVGDLRIKVTAPATDQKANMALIDFLADQLHIAPKLIRLIRGHTSRHKLVEIIGITQEELTLMLRVQSC